MAKWATKFDTKVTRCPGCGKRMRRGDWTYKEGFHVFCRDCGRQKDRSAFEKARTRDRKQTPRLLALPEHVGETRSDVHELRFADGGFYKGQVQDGQMHGKGTYSFPGGDSYSGEFRSGMFCGSGAYTFADGEQHAGIFADDHLSGEGYCIFPDGGRIKGVFADDMFMEGRGWRNYDEGRYRGDFGKGAVMEGVGVFVSEAGDCCIGEFRRDAFWGMGRLIRSGGIVADGVFEDGELKTRCSIPEDLLERAAEAAGMKPREDRIEYSDGTEYIGFTAFGFPHGEGIMRNPAGSSYSGSWYFGELKKAKGTLISRKGNLYEGEIGPGGRPEGRGILRRGDGSCLEGVFAEGKPRDGEMLETDPDGIATRQLYVGGRPMARRGWWEILDSEDEDRDGTNIWLMAEGESRISPVASSNISLGTVMLGDSVREIPPKAFNELYIRRLIIPEGVKNIGREAFLGWGPSQIIAVEGDMTRFSDGWLSGSYAKVISLDELLGDGMYDPASLIRRRMRFPGGAWFEGETRDGIMHGSGVYRFENGDRYEGEFRDGSCCGWGICKFKDSGSYVGEFRDDMPCGAGTMFYLGGDRYEGEWLMGRRFGFGRYTYADGEVVEGIFRDGELLRPCPIPPVLERLCPDSLN